MQDAEEALVEATADAVVTLAASLGGPAFMDAWKVRGPTPTAHPSACDGSGGVKRRRESQAKQVWLFMMP